MRSASWRAPRSAGSTSSPGLTPPRRGEGRGRDPGRTAGGLGPHPRPARSRTLRPLAPLAPAGQCCYREAAHGSPTRRSRGPGRDHSSFPSLTAASASPTATRSNGVSAGWTLDQRAVLVHHYYLGLHLDEVAEALGVPPGTVRSRLASSDRCHARGARCGCPPTIDDRRTADMTAHDGPDLTAPAFDRLMMAWFDAEASVSEPSDLLESDVWLARGRTHPRPAWATPRKVDPDGTHDAPGPVPARGCLCGPQHRPARAGRRRADRRRIAATHPRPHSALPAMACCSSRPRTITSRRSTRRPAHRGPSSEAQTRTVAPPCPLTGPASRSFARSRAVRRFYSVGISGDGLRRLTKDPLVEPAAFAWSPDGSRLAFESDGRLWIARTDGMGSAGGPGPHRGCRDRVAPARRCRAACAWCARCDSAGLFLVDANGQDPQAITPIDGGCERLPLGDVVARRTPGRVPPPPGTRGPCSDHRSNRALRSFGPIAGLGMMFPRFSPDGSRLAVMVWDGTSGSPTRIGVLSSDDPTPAVTLTGPAFISGIQFDWSPDGERSWPSGGTRMPHGSWTPAVAAASKPRGRWPYPTGSNGSERRIEVTEGGPGDACGVHSRA